MYWFLAFYLSFISTAIFANQIDLNEIFKKNDALPDVKADNFISENLKPCFKWLSKDKNAAHYPAFGNSPEVVFLGFKVWEVNVRFAEENFKDAEISFYNRGDAGQVGEGEFKKMLSEIDKKLSEWIPGKTKVLTKKRLPNNIGSIESKVWGNGEILATLIWSLSKNKGSRYDKPEYIKLNISKLDSKNDPRKSYTTSSFNKEKKFAPKDHLKKTEDGDVFIDGIPMVDQGQKGYCAVAVTERVLRHYGQDIDQHVIAQLAQSSAKGGTNSGTMLDMIKKAGSKFKVKVKVYEEAMDSGELARDIQKYNRLLKRKENPPVIIPPVNGDFFGSIYSQIKRDIDIYKEYKCEKCSLDYGKFKRAIVKSINDGIPIVWGVTLGLIPEDKLTPQTAGGHLRMIIGYNNKTNEIVFTDTWGPKHEFKKMNWDNAWTITTSYATILPR